MYNPRTAVIFDTSHDSNCSVKPIYDKNNGYLNAFKEIFTTRCSTEIDLYLITTYDVKSDVCKKIIINSAPKTRYFRSTPKNILDTFSDIANDKLVKKII